MAMNRVQFQAGLSMAKFMELYGTEDQCRAALFRSRWPDGFHCPRCPGAAHSRFWRGEREYFQCAGCRQQTTLESGALLEATTCPWTLVSGFVPADVYKDQRGGTGIDAAFGRVLSNGVASQTQGDAGNDSSRGNASTVRFCADQ